MNKLKHGMDFEESQALWADPDYLEIPARTEEELRWLIVGRISEVHYAAVITYRGEKVRLISVRRARKEELQAYESSRF